MKSLEELKALRDKMADQMGIRADDHNNIRVVVGMATCATWPSPRRGASASASMSPSWRSMSPARRKSPT